VSAPLFVTALQWNFFTAEWRNWHTQQTQNLSSFTGHEGSTPSSATKKHHRRQRMGVIIEEMLEIDVDEIVDVNYLDSPTPGETGGVEVIFKNGTIRVYEGAELPEALAILNHWTPPTA
jgi:hypothetical protein